MESGASSGTAVGGEPGGRSPTLELHPSRWSVAMLLLAGSATFVIGGVLLGRRLLGAAGDEPLVASIVLLVMGALLIAAIGPMAWAPRPILVADARGLHYLPRLGKGESFAWEELAAVGWVRAGKHSGFGLWMRDRQEYVASRPGWQQPLYRLGEAMGRPERRLSVMAGREAATAFAQQIAQHYPVEAR